MQKDWLQDLPDLLAAAYLFLGRDLRYLWLSTTKKLEMREMCDHISEP
ncbi:MAG: hypothetical protein GYA52_11745 [Chloroflexi bacterium]|nr:hypothetical protein [Chloroflexota bacterium]